MKKYLAEMIGTMVLVLMGCGAAVFAGAGQPFDPVGTLGVAFAFGLSVVAMAYAIGSISGCHINPAITLGVLLTGRMSGKDAGLYIVFQIIGAILGSAILWFLAKESGSTTTLTGANGFAEGQMAQAFVAET
ncbi:MAG TPA: aquaporin, partial [Porphyromonadaceae bacterium]|nr:aquaporin [Porphyromonadaceae bacterium]